MPGIPYVRGINDPLGSLASDETSAERVSRAVELRFREFAEAEHLDLVPSPDSDPDDRDETG